MHSNLPVASIIVPTHNRCDLLSRTLGALCAQSYPADRMEVILVADGCTDETVEFAQQYASPWKLKILEQPGLGPATARNRGAAQARGEVLIFLDDDMEVVPGFVAAHAEIQQSSPRTVAVGFFRLASHDSDSYWGRSVWEWWEGKFFEMRQPGYRFQYDDFFAGNFSVRSDFFAEVGGFDPELRCHEDYELGLRFLMANARCTLAMDAAAYHHDATDMSRALKRRFAEGQADVYLSRRHGGLYERLPLAHPPFTLLSRSLDNLAHKMPFLADRIAGAGQSVLSGLEVLRLFPFWKAIFYLLQQYWYWRGVRMADKPSTIQELPSTEPGPSIPVIIDLSHGIGEAERDLDLVRPVSARLFFGKQWVEDIPGLLGIEQLRGDHLRPLLATRLYRQMTVAMALSSLMPIPKDDKSTEIWQKEWKLPVDPDKALDWNAYLSDPKKVIEIDLANGIPEVDITGYSGLHALVRSQSRLLGCITLAGWKDPSVSAMALQQAITKQLGEAAIPLSWTTPTTPESWPSISVIVCTRNRTSQLAECLRALLELDYLHYEILVVDNAPDDEQTARLAAGLPVRYIREERRGLDWARNRGIREARHPIVAFIDDDAQADQGWLRAIAAVFNEPEVMAVTGSVLPAKLETPAQNLFEFGYGGMNHGFQRRMVRRITLNDMQLLWASGFGVGANMAFRKVLFEEIGRFDVALDVGTPSGGGGDVELFHRLIAKNNTLVYEPAALVWHQHRTEMADLRKLVTNNGRSFGCYLITNARNRTVHPVGILYFALRFWLWGWIGKRLVKPRSTGVPRWLVWQELLAALSSPVAYLHSQIHARKSRLLNEGTIEVKNRAPEKGMR